MEKDIKSDSIKFGLPPGSMVHVGEQKIHKVKILLIQYDEISFNINEISSIDEIKINNDQVNWIHITGLHDIALLDKIKIRFNIPPLIMEDIFNTNQRPKIEILEDKLYSVLKNIQLDKDLNEINTSQVSLILKENMVISFLEQPIPTFDPIIERIRKKTGQVRTQGEDYLFYILIDILVDNYFFILEDIEDIIDELDDYVMLHHSSGMGTKLQKTRKMIILLRKFLLPLRETIFGYLRKGSPLIKTATLPYFRDLKDHLIRVVEMLDTMNDLLMNIMAIYFSNINLRMNEVIRILTIISTIFIPLTFIAGIYGMNFKHMPELDWKYGYYMVWAINLLVIGIMFLFFKKKKWF